jgi:hypothetical protein
MSSLGMESRITAHLARNFGVVTRRELIEAGISARQVEGLLTRGELVRVHAGVCRHSAAPITYDQRVYAGLCAVVGSVGSHRTGLVLRGTRNFSADLVELSTTASGSRRSGLFVHRTATLDRSDLCVRRGLKVTAPARTLVDAATVMAPQLVARFAQDWLANHVVKLDDLHAALERVGSRNHADAFRRALVAVDLGGADSVPEARLGEILTRAGIPPVLHHVVTTAEGRDFELDWSYPHARVGLEVDGYGVHVRSFDAFEDDRDRRNEIVLIGWRVLNFTSRMIRNRPAHVIGQVRRALALAA